MKFGTGSTTELTQKREGQSTKMPYLRPNIYVTVPRKRDLFRNKVKNELFIPLCRALLMENFDIKFIGRRSLVH